MTNPTGIFEDYLKDSKIPVGFVKAFIAYWIFNKLGPCQSYPHGVLPVGNNIFKIFNKIRIYILSKSNII